MRALRHWSLARVLVVSVAWFLLSLAGLLYLALRSFSADFGEGSGGVAMVSVGFNTITLMIPVVPPIVLIVAWLIARRPKAA
jgi:hypothetical protein